MMLFDTTGKALTRGAAVKMIFFSIRDFGYGLPRAIEIYNYLSCFDTEPVSQKDIYIYLLKSGLYDPE